MHTRTYLVTIIIILLIAISLTLVYIMRLSHTSVTPTTPAQQTFVAKVSTIPATSPSLIMTPSPSVDLAISSAPLPVELTPVPFTIVETNPPDQAVDVDRAISTISINTDIPIEESMFTFALYPTTAYEIDVRGRSITITFQEPLKEGVRYLYVIYPMAGDNGAYSFSFIVEGTMPTVEIPKYNSGEIGQRADEYTQAHRPDLHLANHLPYTSEYFYGSKALKRAPTFHYTFIFQLRGNDNDTAEQVARDWMNDIGLTDEQIETLDIAFVAHE